MTMTREISNTDDVIDSRDIIERIEELQGIEERDEEEQTELGNLLALQEEAEGYAPDWKYGCALIRDSYFTEYTRELCDDIGSVPKDFPHWIEIDWEATARNVRTDYTSVEFGDVTYWVR